MGSRHITAENPVAYPNKCCRNPEDNRVCYLYYNFVDEDEGRDMELYVPKAYIAFKNL